jgi:hypothetical protein
MNKAQVRKRLTPNLMYKRRRGWRMGRPHRIKLSSMQIRRKWSHERVFGWRFKLNRDQKAARRRG